MSKFTGRERLFIGALIAVCGARLWRDRKLKRAVRAFEYNNRLLLAATRVAQNARSLLDIEQILKVTIEEVVPAVGVDQFIVRIEGSGGGPSLVRYYPGEGGGAAVSALTADFDACRTSMGHRVRNYYLRQGRARGRDGALPPETAKPILGAPIAYADQYLGALMVRSDDPTRVWLDSEVQALLAVAHQIWESVSQARLFAEKEQQSLTDPLTSCPNRRAFDLRLGSDLRLAGETNQPLSLVMVDVDHFKRVNDTYGHAPGDQVLRALADVLREEITGGAMAARIGGEEFALVLPGFGVEKAGALAVRTRARIARMKVPDINGQITASFGVATFPLHASSCSSLIESADRALYRAKNSGRNRVCTP
jgi:diguanylate cyclase (GGDEF)-like protein